MVRAREAAARAIAFYERGLARIEDRWAGTGETGERFRDPEHLYAQDLDLFGPASLFELLSIARTQAGEETLARWLLAPADTTAILARQQATEDLAPRLDLREALSLAGTDVRASVHTDALVAWAEGPLHLRGGWIRPVAIVLSIAAIATAGAWIATGNSTPFVAVVMLEIAFSLPLRERLAKALGGADGPARDLDVLAVVLARLEQEQFTAERLTRLQGELTGTGTGGRLQPARRRIRFNSPAPSTRGAARLAAQPRVRAVCRGGAVGHAPGARHRGVAPRARPPRARVAADLGRVRGARVAVGVPLRTSRRSVSRDRRDGDADGAAGRVRRQGGLGHPLIPAARMIRNDVHLGSAPHLLVVSGSNMSGKSTLLRTVGVNAVLAFAGAPVRAGSLRLTPMRIGATLRIQDSLQEGRSRFYAEISRIRDIADLASGPLPVLFLLDELFHGTNSHDRVVGASGVLRALLDRDAIGLITTHDLALTTVADDLAPRAANVHFDDRFEGGEIRFDYVMKPGPVTRSNAIALMRAVGLDVPQD